ncbi:hypothetical protein ACEG18_05870 [Collinsella aerofaciens]|uniref:hypothetical protein n=1 Tax=Collinsella aerofaciens TaxID=74426 RepID=UPI00355B0857
METTARGNVPKTLHNIAFVSIPESADLEFLLWDLQDAIAAYAQLSGTVLPHPVDLKANSADAADGIVLAVEDMTDDEAMADIAKALDRFGDTGTRVYVVVRAACERSEGARMLIERLRQACELRRLTWCGGVIACTGSGIAKLRHSPRMGILRRPFSEAMDKLVGAVRMGCSVEHAQLLGGGGVSNFDPDGVITAKPAIPTWLWRLATRHCG